MATISPLRPSPPSALVVDAASVDRLVDHLAVTGGLSMERVDRPPSVGSRARAYRLWLQPTLDGDIDLIREWGRLGSGNGHPSRPRQLVSSHPSSEAALAAAAPVVRRRLRRGYGHHGHSGT